MLRTRLLSRHIQLLTQRCSPLTLLTAPVLGLSLLCPVVAIAATDAVPTNLSSAFEIQQAQPNLMRLQQDQASTLPRLATVNAPAGADQVRFTLQQVRLVGNSRMTSQSLQPEWQAMLGQTVSLADMYALAARLTAAYQAQGYVLSQVIVPEQTVQNGRVTLQVIEGYVDHITVLGDFADHPLIRAYSKQLSSERPTTARSLERIILLLNDLGGMQAQAMLQPASATATAGEPSVQSLGAVNLLIQTQPVPVQGRVGIHNRVNQSLGDYRVDASLIAGNTLGLLEQHYLGVSSSLDRKVNTAVYQGTYPLMANGLQSSLTLSAAQVRPEINGVEVSESNSLFASVGLSYPALRSRTANVVAYSAFDWYQNQRDSLFDQSRENDEQLRVLTLGSRIEQRDRWQGINQFDWSAQLGLDALDASQAKDPLLSGSGGQGQPQFFKHNLYLARTQPLSTQWSWLTAVNAQWSRDVLLSSQQFTAGGDQFLRAYDAGELSGDRGVATKLELRYQQAIGATQLTHYGFYDWAEARLNSTHDNLAMDRKDHAQAVGIGTRFSTVLGINGYLEVAKPINRNTNQDQSTDPRVFGGLAVTF